MAKPKASGISLEDLESYAEELGDYEVIENLISDSRIFEKLQEKEEITFIARVLIEIEQYTRAMHNGTLSAEEFNYYRTKAGDVDVSVPLLFMKVIGDAWRKYLTAPTGTSLGEAFGLEGGGQGRQKSRDKLQNIVKGIRMARIVLLCRAHCEKIGKPVSVKKACAEIADRLTERGDGHSAEALEEAHDKYKRLIRETMPAAVIGGKTS